MSFECLGPWSWRVHGLGRLGIRARVLRAEGSEVKRFYGRGNWEASGALGALDV